MLGQNVTPKDHQNTERLMRYWSEGEGRALWANDPHPYSRLVELLSKYVHDPAILHGLAANLFKRVFGIYPGQRPGVNHGNHGH